MSYSNSSSPIDPDASDSEKAASSGGVNKRYRRSSRMRTQSKESSSIKTLRYLVWAYFFLVIFEGALRKWVVPSLSTPLLIIRDPIVIWAYYIAWRKQLFPKHPLLVIMFPLAQLTLAGGFLAGLVDPRGVVIPVIIYGFRTHFLHLPFIFLIGRALRWKDLKWMANIILLLVIPMSVLMAFQLQAGADSWLNASPGGEVGSQLEAALGRVRPSGTFSFTSGPSIFIPYAFAFWCWGFVEKRICPTWILLCGGGGILLASIVSISRGIIFGEIMVFMGVLFVALRQPITLMPRVTKLIASGMTMLVVLQGTQFFQAGSEVFNARLENTRKGTNALAGSDLVGRVFGEFVQPFLDLGSLPLFGFGLGLGTNVGAQLQPGQRLRIAESEWLRILKESGPFIGVSLILFRIGILIWLFQLSLKSIRRQHYLCFFMLCAGWLGIIHGQWGITTVQGITIWAMGVCLASSKK